MLILMFKKRMAAKRKKTKSIRRTTKGKGANYRPTKKGGRHDEKRSQGL